MKYLVSAALVLPIVLAFALGCTNRSQQKTPVANGDSPKKSSPAKDPAETLVSIRVGKDVPRVGRPEYASSSTCKECHSNQHASWHQSYHRTMTQVASPEAVQAPFEGETLEALGRTFTMTREGDLFVVDMPDPEWEINLARAGVDIAELDPPRVKRRIALTTGSHHMQAYWIPSQDGNKLRQLPWVYHIGAKLWMPNEASFLQPPGDPNEILSSRQTTSWNYYCINCHAVGGKINRKSEFHWDTEVAEFGIACEACHGPAEEHVAHHRAVRDNGQSNISKSAAALVNPARKSPKIASEICGQCHSDNLWNTRENTYRPGDNLASMCVIGGFENTFDKLRFWGDGTMRVGGREYLGMIKSACHLNGDMSCLSCHSMHDGSRDDQLRAKMRTNEACYACHAEFKEQLAEHTHHAPQSAGSLCYNCHAPYTTYALFKGIRSHRIDIPSVETSVQHGRPNACNQCHLDRTLQWTNETLHEWHGTEMAEVPQEHHEHPASVVWMLKGDAVQRALMAWTYRWPSALEASGDQWQPPLLAELLTDEYPAVRFIASQSLKQRDEFKDWKFNYVANEDELKAMQQEAIQRFPQSKTIPTGLSGWFQDGQLRASVAAEMLKQQDRKQISLSE